MGSNMTLLTFLYLGYIAIFPDTCPANIRLDEDVVVKTNIFVLAIRLQDVLPRRLQDVFKTSSRRLAKRSSRHLQDVLKTSSKRLQDVLKNVFMTSSRRLQDVSSS